MSFFFGIKKIPAAPERGAKSSCSDLLANNPLIQKFLEGRRVRLCQENPAKMIVMRSEILKRAIASYRPWRSNIQFLKDLLPKWIGVCVTASLVEIKGDAAHDRKHTRMDVLD